MNRNQELEKRLEQLKVEDFLWLVLIGLLILSISNNETERHFLITKDERSKTKYRYTQIFIFSIAILIYLYYAITSYEDVTSLNNNNPQRSSHAYLSFISSLSILFAGILLLYIATTDVNVETEIALN